MSQAPLNIPSLLQEHSGREYFIPDSQKLKFTHETIFPNNLSLSAYNTCTKNRSQTQKPTNIQILKKPMFFFLSTYKRPPGSWCQLNRRPKGICNKSNQTWEDKFESKLFCLKSNMNRTPTFPRKLPTNPKQTVETPKGIWPRKHFLAIFIYRRQSLYFFRTFKKKSVSIYFGNSVSTITFDK